MTRTTLEQRIRDAARLLPLVLEGKVSPCVLENLFEQTIRELDACPVRVVETTGESA